jgi:hypothetical protein
MRAGRIRRQLQRSFVFRPKGQQNMRVTLRKCLWAQVACLSLWPVLALAQSSDLAQNLADCKNGRETCDRSKLNQSESADVALAGHGRNVSNCRNGYDFCDHSKLTEPEAVALAVADHQRNVSNCNDGRGSCDRSKLTQTEAGEMAVAENQRNLANCKDGVGDCDRSKLSPSEAGAEVRLDQSARSRGRPQFKTNSFFALKIPDDLE